MSFIVLEELTTYNWFQSYLFNRRQYASLGRTHSDEHIVSCDVPQGSVLGPLLFLIYMNDFPNSTNFFEMHLFADDCNLLYSHKDINELEKLTNTHLSKIHLWLSSNELTLNIDKTNFVIFHPTQ